MQTLAVQLFLKLDWNQSFAGLSTKRTSRSGIRGLNYYSLEILQIFVFWNNPPLGA